MRVPNLQAEARHVAEEVMKGMNGTTGPLFVNTSGSESPRSLEPPANTSKPTATSSKHPVPVRTSSYNRTTETTKETNQSQEDPSRRSDLDTPTELDGVSTDAVTQVRSNEEELSQRSLPVRPVSGIDEGMKEKLARREMTEIGNLSFESQDRRSSVIRSSSAKGCEALPTVTTSSNETDREDDRTPTNRGSFGAMSEQYMVT